MGDRCFILPPRRCGLWGGQGRRFDIRGRLIPEGSRARFKSGQDCLGSCLGIASRFGGGACGPNHGTSLTGEKLTVAGGLGVACSDPGGSIGGAPGSGARAFFAGRVTVFLGTAAAGAMGSQALIDFLFPGRCCRLLFV